jgi:hypothetical protein
MPLTAPTAKTSTPSKNMCVIISSPDKKHRPSLATLRAAEARNPHGSGIAFLQHNKVQWIKGLSPEAIAELLDIVSGPAVVHFRIATVGGKRAELCHPFPISPTAPLKAYGQASAVLFHNGHWHDWQDFAMTLKLEGPLSDSRVMAAAVHRDGRALLKKIASAGRFVILTRKGAEIYGQWTHHEGCDYSNTIGLGLDLEQPQPPPAAKASTAAPQQYKLTLTPRTPRDRSLVEEAMACYGD